MIVQIIGWFCLIMGSVAFLTWSLSSNFVSDESKQRRALILIVIALFLICAAICFK